MFFSNISYFSFGLFAFFAFLDCSLMCSFILRCGIPSLSNLGNHRKMRNHVYSDIINIKLFVKNIKLHL